MCGRCRRKSASAPSMACGVHCSKYRYAPHNDVSVNDRPHIRRWSHKIIVL